MSVGEQETDGLRPVLHVVVVAYRSAALLGACLGPLLADPGVGRVVVVDNSADAATEAVCRRLAAAEGRIQYLTMPNVGYARAVNAGAGRRDPQTSHIAVLNPDVALTRSVSELVQRTSDHPRTVVSALLDQRGGCLNVRPMTGLRRELLAAVVGSRAHRMRSLPGEPGSVRRVPQIDGSFMVLPLGEFSALGGLDERFELYFEDVDLCRRADARSGCWVVNETWGSHVGGASFAASGAAPYVALRASRAKFLRKWYGRAAVPVVLASAALELVARSVTRTTRWEVVRAGFAAQVREVFRPGERRYLEAQASPAPGRPAEPASTGRPEAG